MEAVKKGEVMVEEAVETLKGLPYEEVGGAQDVCATVDHHRELRTGFSEVIFCAGKTAGQVAEIAEKLAARGGRVLGTRASREQFEAARLRVPGMQWNELGRAMWLDRSGSGK